MTLFLIGLAAYLIGNISFSLILSKLVYKKDVRKYGSGNAGTTNMIRAFGFKIGILTFIGDALKGMLAAFMGYKFGGTNGLYIAGIMVIVGHNWPVFLKFKGGKGVATTIGVMLYVLFWPTLVCLIIGIGLAFVTRIVSIGSLIGICLSSLYVLIFYKPFDITLLMFTLVYTAMCLFKHRANIERLIKGEEKKL